MIERIEHIFAELEKLSCKRRKQAPYMGISLVPTRRLTKDEQARFGRLVRAGTHLEARGQLVAQVDRHGRVVAWLIRRK